MSLRSLLGHTPSLALVGLLCVASQTALGAVVRQIPRPFVTETFAVTGGTVASSQTEFNPPPGDNPTFARAFGNFSFVDSIGIRGFDWVGLYDSDDPLDPTASSFTVDIFDDVAGGLFGSQPGTSIFSFNAGLADETPIAGFDGFNRYRANLPTPFSVVGGQDYWFSVTANLDFGNPSIPGTGNLWGLA